jgi:hypothetical protein
MASLKALRLSQTCPASRETILFPQATLRLHLAATITGELAGLTGWADSHRFSSLDSPHHGHSAEVYCHQVARPVLGFNRSRTVQAKAPTWKKDDENAAQLEGSKNAKAGSTLDEH